MSTSLRDTLCHLSQAESFHYFSTQYRYGSERVLDGLYLCRSWKALVGRRLATCYGHERQAVQDCIERFLANNREKYEQRDRPAICQIEGIVRRMCQSERSVDRTIYTEIFSQIYEPQSKPERAEYDEAIRLINGSWFLECTLELQEVQTCQEYVHFLYEKSSSNSPLNDNEWLVLARGLSVLIQHDCSMLIEAKTVFLRYFIRKGRPEEIEREYKKLLDILYAKKSPFLGAYIAFIRSSFFSNTVGSNRDPNAAIALDCMLEEYYASLWKDKSWSRSLVEYKCDRPWDGCKNAKTDRDKLTYLCQQLLDFDDMIAHLDQVNLVLLFVLSSHTLQGGMRTCGQHFQKLMPKVNALFRSIGKRRPNCTKEKKSFSNFRKLYQFYIGSDFAKRKTEEQNGRSKGRGSGVGERWSLWGFKNTRERTLAGNVQENFTIQNLRSSLKEVQAVAIREQKKRAPHRKEKFQLSKAAPLRSPPSGNFFVWQELCTGAPISRESWGSLQDRAKEYSKQIVSRFQRVIPMDFLSLVESIKTGGTEAVTYVKMYEDHGLVLLRDYVYPYCILEKIMEMPFDHVAAKFVYGAASPEEIESLGTTTEKKAAILFNVLFVLNNELKEGAIHSNQIEMLSTMVRSIDERKQVYICNDTGSGKTTMSKLAPSIVPFSIPVVVHVFPFAEEEKGWQRLVRWSDLERVKQRGETNHFWITATDLGVLLQQMERRHSPLVKNAFFLMDEYDDKAYTIEGGSAIQDALFDVGCQRIVNMSATPNLETLQSKSERYRKKRDLATLLDVQEYYGRKMLEVDRQHDELLVSIATEWGRHIQIKEIESTLNSQQQIAHIFPDIAARISQVKKKEMSILIEMPQLILNEEVVRSFQEGIQQTVGEKKAALLFRDSSGYIQAQIYGGEWKTVSGREFFENYSEDRGLVFCVYTQDSSGGDFKFLSNERLVEGQFIVYYREISPSYTIFQNLRRLRRQAGPLAIGNIPPVTMYIGGDTSALMEGGDPIEIKKRVLTQANYTASQLSREREIGRLKVKTVRKKQKALFSFLDFDFKQLEMKIETSLSQNTVKAALKKSFDVQKEKSFLSFTSVIDDERKRVIREAIIGMEIPVENKKFSREKVQEREVVVSLAEAFGDIQGYFDSGKDLFERIKKIVTEVYKRSPTCVGMWLRQLTKISGQKGDDVLHPKPTFAAIASALRCIRLKKDFLDVESHIEAGIQSPGIAKPFPPAQLLKVMMGTSTLNHQVARSYLEKLLKERKEAILYQEEHKQYMEAHVAECKTLKMKLLQYLDEIDEGAVSAETALLLSQVDLYSAKTLQYSHRS